MTTQDPELYGLRVLYEPSDRSSTVLDVVAVHGMGAHPDKTWRGATNASKVDGSVSPDSWLSQGSMLPAIIPDARIMRYGYASEWRGEDAIRTNVKAVSLSLLRRLKSERKDCSSRPLIFIAHCFGGLVVLKLLVQAHREPSIWPGILWSTTGLLFFGTPFRGTHEAFSQSDLVRLAAEQISEQGGHPQNLRILQAGDDSLQDLVDSYLEVARQGIMPRAACFYEQKETNIGPILNQGSTEHVSYRVMMVNESSGCLDLNGHTDKYAMPRNHFTINKFSHPKEEGFLTVGEVIQDMKVNGPAMLRSRYTAHISKAPRYHDDLPDAVNHFFGRESLLARLERATQRQEQSFKEPRVIVLQGMGGQGKTQLALEFCRRRADYFRGIFWINASSKDFMERDLDVVAQKVCEQGYQPHRNLKLRLAILWHILHSWEEDYIFIYDNCDSTRALSNVRTFLPRGDKGCAIVISRHEEARTVATTFLRVPSMLHDGGLEMLMNSLHIGSSVEDDAHGKHIVKRLGGLPLAIRHAANYMENHDMPISEFMSHFEEKKKYILQSHGEVWEYKKSLEMADTNFASTALTTWEMSLAQIGAYSHGSIDQITEFLGVCAFLNPFGIEEKLFQTYLSASDPPPAWLKMFSKSAQETTADSSSDGGGSSSIAATTDDWCKEGFRMIVQGLRKISILQSVRDRNGDLLLTIHPLVQDWLQHRQGKSRRRSCLRNAITVITANVSATRIQAIPMEKRRFLLGHADLLVAAARRQDIPRLFKSEESRADFTALGYLFFNEGKYESARTLCDTLSALQSSAAAEERPDVLDTLQLLGSTYLALGKFEEAARLHSQVYQARLHQLGATNDATLQSAHNLATALERLGRWEEAETLQRHVVDLEGQLHTKSTRGTLGSKSRLASIIQSQGRWSEAEALHLQILHEKSTLFGDADMDTLSTMSELAVTYWQQGRWDESEKHERQALKGVRGLYGDDHPSTLNCMYNLAVTLHSTGQREEAEAMQRDVHRKARATLGPDNPETLRSAEHLATMYWYRDELDNSLFSEPLVSYRQSSKRSNL